MRYTIVPLALGLGASAAITKRGEYPLQFIAKGKAHGTIGQLPDGQVRIGGGYAPAHFKIHKGIMRDHNGRGCVETEPEKQIQCDYGNHGDETFSVNDEHRLEYDDSCSFWACPVNDDDEWNVYTRPLDGQDKCVPIEVYVYHEEPKHHHSEEPKHHHDEDNHHHDEDNHHHEEHHQEEHHHEEHHHEEHHHPKPPKTSHIPPCPGKECEKHHQKHCPDHYSCEKPDYCECHKPSSCHSCKEHDHVCYSTCTVTKTEHKTEHKTKTKFATKTKHTTATATAYRWCEKECHGDRHCMSTCTVTETMTKTKCHAGSCSKPTPYCGKSQGCSKGPKGPKGPKDSSSGAEFGEYDYDDYNPYWRALTPGELTNQKRDTTDGLTLLKTSEKYRDEQRSKYNGCTKSCHNGDDEEHCYHSCATDRCKETCGSHKKPCFDQCYPHYHHEPSWCPDTREKPCPKDRDCRRCGFGNYPNYYPGLYDGYGDLDHHPFPGGERGGW